MLFPVGVILSYAVGERVRLSQDFSRAEAVQNALEVGDLQRARSLVFHWLEAYREIIKQQASRAQLRHPELWGCLADVVERTNDQYLLEIFWQMLDGLPTPCSAENMPLVKLPLLGIPILNRPDLLSALLASIDFRVEILAIVDNSGGEASLRSFLEELEIHGHPLVDKICIARGFGNSGVAESWNQILLGFPSAPLALIVNNDIKFVPGCIERAIASIDCTQPQFLSLLAEPASFSAFFITLKAWDRIGLFNSNFYPAYCEDLEFRDRLRLDPCVQIIDGSFCHEAMALVNDSVSQTISSNSEYQFFNSYSFALNRLWYLSHRRIRGDARGAWVRRWLCEWSN